MPIYAYRCSSCGHAQDVLQKMSDPLLSECPACGAAAFTKQLTAAGFQLKGSGWYATDFRGGKTQPPEKDGAEAGADKPADKAGEKNGEKATTAKADQAGDKALSKPGDKPGDKAAEKKPAGKAADKPAAAPPAAAPSTGA